MATTYYVLKSNTTILPQEAYFEDENVRFKPTPNDTFNTFFKRIKTTHKTDLDDHLLSELVLTSLIETTPLNKLNTYFRQIEVPPSMAQVRSFAKTYARQLLSRARSKTTLTPNTINDRIDSCIGCKFHQARATSSNLTKSIANSATNPFENLKNLNKLGVCGACGCPLQAKVKYEIIPILADLAPHQIALIIKGLTKSAFSRCWMLKEALQSPNTKRLLINKIRHAEPALEKYLNAHEKQKAN